MTIENLIRNYNLIIKDRKYKNYMIKKVMHNKKVLTIKSCYDGENNEYYIHIRFAGLTNYRDEDNISFNLLIEITTLLKNKNIPFEIREIDIALDVYCNYKNVVMLCTKKTPKTKYYTLNEKQPFKTTRYLEKATRNSKIRSYTYCKTTKENLNKDITRNEIKFKRQCLKDCKTSNELIEVITKNINRYKVLYFRTLEEKQYLLNKLGTETSINKRVQKKYKIYRYELTFDIEYIEMFINELYIQNSKKVN